MNYGTIKRAGAYLLGEWDPAYFREVASHGPEEAAAFQRKSLEELVSIAYGTSYYRQLFDRASIDVRDFEPRDLERLPTLTKDKIRMEGDRLLSKDHMGRKPFEKYSGGSTGEPVRIVQDRDFLLRSYAIFQVFYRDFLDMDEMAVRKVLLWGDPNEAFGGKKGLLSRFRLRMSRITFLNSFRMTEEDVADYVRRIDRVRPELIRGYAGSLYQIARHINRNGSRVHRPKAVVSTAEMLRPFMREEIEKAFGAGVHDWYGSREVGSIAGECEHHKMHLITLQNHVEVLDANDRPVGPGEEGKLVLTNLVNHPMPLVRFEIGDTAVLGSGRCRCGSELPFLERVTGRISDHFVLRNGTMVHGTYFDAIICLGKNRGWVQNYQVVQEDYERVLFKIVPSARPNEEDIAEIEKRVRVAMGQECAVEWEFVDRIETTATGKHLYSKTLVGREAQRPS